jgi:hypothetical protein
MVSEQIRDFTEIANSRGSHGESFNLKMVTLRAIPAAYILLLSLNVA